MAVLISLVKPIRLLALLIGVVAPVTISLAPGFAVSGPTSHPVGFAHRAQTELAPTNSASVMATSVANAPGIAVAGDASETVAGASFAGAVEIYSTSGGTLKTSTPVRTLTAPSPQSHEWYGDAVATDGRTLVVGAPDTTVTALGHAGVVDVYERPTAGWQALSTPVATLTSPTPSTDGYFGISVAVEGDTVVVGASGEHNNDGNVYVFTKPKSGWSANPPHALLTTSATWDEAGESVAIDGDLIAVGAPGTSTAGLDYSGAIDLYVEPDNGLWTSADAPTRQLVESDPALDEGLGSSVSTYGPYVVGGAPATFGGQPGRVDVFSQPVGGWVGTGAIDESAQLTDSAAPNVTEFGTGVAIDGSQILSAAPQQTTAGKTEAGVVDVFGLPKNGYRTTSTPSARVTGTSPQTKGLFGASLADDGSQILVGAPGVVAGGTTTAPRGAAYLFTSLPRPKLTGVAESKKSWKHGRKRTELNPKKPMKTGTAFRFSTNQPMSVTLSFAKKAHGRYSAAHKLTVSAAKGTNVVYFDGRLTRSTTLGAATYRVVIAAANAAGDKSAAQSLNFTIK
jgi:FG-GAP repeat